MMTIKRACVRVGCGGLRVAGSRYCAGHAGYAQAAEATVRRLADAARGSAHARGYGHRWSKASKGFLAARGYRCAGFRIPAGQACLTAASVTDHIVPHKGDMRLFWDAGNWQPLCKRCHDRKTATEDGGFRGAGGVVQTTAGRGGAAVDNLGIV